MGGRAQVGGLLAALVGLGLCGPARAEDAEKPASRAPILEMTKRAAPSAEKAMTDAIREGALTPAPAAVQEWVLQSDGTMKNTRTGISIALRNVCAPGDFDHEAALAAYNRAQAGKSRSR